MTRVSSRARGELTIAVLVVLVVLVADARSPVECGAVESAAVTSTTTTISSATTTTEPALELNTALMQSTFMVTGTHQGRPYVGTAFVIGKPYPKQPSQARYVLVTAAHVLRDADGDAVTLIFRQKTDSGNWKPLPQSVQIRQGSEQLWVEPAGADVAAMYVSLPNGVIDRLVPTTLLADDEEIEDFGLHPGDPLYCLGYPLGFQANDAGFPVLRSGPLASYPLVPTKTVKYFLFDFRVFGGNSGGPVYVAYEGVRRYGGGMRLGGVQMIVGLVSAQVSVKEHVKELYSEREEEYPLSLARVVPASFIRTAIDMLAPLPETADENGEVPAPAPPQK